MSKVSISRVIMVSVNEISEAEEEQLLDSHDADSLEAVANEMSETVESLLAHNVFGDADKIPLMSVETDIEEEYNEEDYEDLRGETE
jgi:hypothetical protein